MARRGLLLHSGADQDVALAIFEEATGTWGDHVETKEVVGNFNNVPLTASEFNQDFDCHENDSV